MKAIIKMNSSSSSYYAKFNFLTFEVSEIGSSFVSINGLNPEFPQNKTDFSFDEIIIVDIAKEIEKAKDLKKIAGLQRYCTLKKIQF